MKQERSQKRNLNKGNGTPDCHPLSSRELF